jgi:uncharacterized protein
MTPQATYADPMANRLARSTSPYLRQHADNPVDWFEWGDEAFEQAGSREVPILLSVGYAACHWCHVMAHESFEDPAVAALMNAWFVNVKVDREERPDVDATYMAVTQAMTGSGGWPMTVFMTPQGRPFYAGTYYPPQPRHGMNSFPQVLQAIHDTWTDRRDDVEAEGARLSKALARPMVATLDGVPGSAELARAVGVLAAAEDTRHGGFGRAPKFPPSMTLEFLLRHGDPTALEMAGRALTAMARSGMYDQVAGGFARYAVDAAWVVPHFEKMLTDNALLARVYLHWWRATGEPTGARIAAETCDWMLTALGTDQGALACSLDADTEGVEGSTYVWTPTQLRQVLGPVDGDWAADLLAVTDEGTFEHGSSTLQLPRDVWADPAEAQRWQEVRHRLRLARAGRPQPGRDDKVVAAWNGLAIAALAEAGVLLERPDLLAAAERAAAFVLDTHLVAGDGDQPARLRRVSRDGVVGAPAGVLEDYGDLAEGLLALHGATGEPRWLTAAGGLLDVALAHFADPDRGFYDTADDATDAALALIRRPQDPTDSAYPSGTSAVAGALATYAALTGSDVHRQAGLRALGAAAAAGAQAPAAFGWALAVAEAVLCGPLQVAVVGADDDPVRAELHRTALRGTSPGLVTSVGVPDAAGVPLLAGRPLRPDAAGRLGAAAYVCRDLVCDAPTGDPAVLAVQVAKAV